MFLTSAMCRSPLSKRVQPQPSSPFQGSTDSDKGSPNKSPLQLIPPPPPPQPMHGKLMPSSNFNPNAPSFVPMVMQCPLSIVSVQHVHVIDVHVCTLKLHVHVHCTPHVHVLYMYIYNTLCTKVHVCALYCMYILYTL